MHAVLDFLMEDTFGKIYRLTDGGDTHGAALWGKIEGCPPGIFVDEDAIASDMKRRAPSCGDSSTRRRETDAVEFLAGVDSSGHTTKEPILFRIPNMDVRPDERNRNVIRPSHASYTYFRKYGFTDNELCGRASARQTACRVVAGAIAKLALQPCGISIHASTLYAGTPNREGDTAGAIVRGNILNLPAGLGEPVYDKFSARLAYAMLSINAARGFEIGLGYDAARMSGSQYNDIPQAGYEFQSNHDGGVQAGITNGQEVYFTVAFKPIPAVRFDQPSIDFVGNPAVCRGSDRNDLCVVPRVLPVVEAMAAMVVLDFILIQHL